MGDDPAVVYRVVEDIDCADENKFIRRIEFMMLPNGHVQKGIKGCQGVHRLLAEMIFGGVVE